MRGYLRYLRETGMWIPMVLSSLGVILGVLALVLSA